MKREKVKNSTEGGVMRKVLVVAAVAAGIVGLAMVADAATDITNWCTGTYQLTGAAASASGIDSAIVHAQSAPSIAISKFATNLRSAPNNTQAYMVNAVSGDTILFKITWVNNGEATADTIVLRDYVPSGMTYVAASVGDSEVNATGTASQAGGLVSYTGNSVAGIDPGPRAYGGFWFRATVN